MIEQVDDGSLIVIEGYNRCKAMSKMMMLRKWD